MALPLLPRADTSAGQRGTSVAASRITRVGFSVPVARVVSAGKAHSFILTSTGAVFGIGSSAHGRLGTGSEATVVNPTRISALAHTRVVQVRVLVRPNPYAVVGGHSCGLFVGAGGRVNFSFALSE